MDIIEAIRIRRSVRSYSGEPLNGQQRAALAEVVGAASNPFGNNPTVRLCSFNLKGDFRPSTYGVIKGATDYLTMCYAAGETDELAAGYQFEQIVLNATRMGLGTCWIAATFKASVFDSGTPWPNGQSLRVVSPVGIPAGKRIAERLMRLAFGCDHRKPFGELFFSCDSQSPLPSESTFYLPLEMMRLAPSSTNSQPWRAYVDEPQSTVHFCYKPKSALSVLDCGIGLCHFHAAEMHAGHDGHFFRDEIRFKCPAGLKYLLTYTRAD